MSHIRASAILLFISTGMVVLAGCTTSTRGTSTSTSPSPPQALATASTVDWASVVDDVDCTPINRGVELEGTALISTRPGAGPDVWVWVDCVHDASTWPDQLEVYDGSSPASAPTRLAVLISRRDALKIRTVSSSGNSAVVDAAGYSANAPLCCPDLAMRLTFTWTGFGFERKVQQYSTSGLNTPP